MAIVDLRNNASEIMTAPNRMRDPSTRYSQSIVLFVMVAFDVVAIVSSAVFVDTVILHRDVFWSDFGQASVVASCFYVYIFKSFGSYRTFDDVNVLARCGRAIVAWAATLMLLVLSAFMLKVGDHYSRIGATLFAVTGLIAVVAENAIFARMINTRVRNGMIVFARVQTITLEATSERSTAGWEPPFGFQLTGAHQLQLSIDDFATRCREIRDSLQREIAVGNCDQIVINSDWTNKTYIEALLRSLGPLSAPVLLLSDFAITKLYRQRRVSLGDHIGFELQSAPLGRADRLLKRAMDVIISIAGIIVLSPVMLLATVAICLETGLPILFRQDRRGFGGVPFKILKFRSMSVSENGTHIQQASRGDPRITSIGRILRRTSIDELPQLFNVLKGEMSIVGPRPHAKAHDDYYDNVIEQYAFRHHVKPGITGWAQIHGARGATETDGAMQTRVEYDLWYINHWSLWLDVRIILRTAFKILVDENAY